MVSDFFLDRHAPPALAKTTEGGAYPSAQLKYIEQPLKEGSTGSGYPPSTHPPTRWSPMVPFVEGLAAVEEWRESSEA